MCGKESWGTPLTEVARKLPELFPAGEGGGTRPRKNALASVVEGKQVADEGKVERGKSRREGAPWFSSPVDTGGRGTKPVCRASGRGGAKI